MKLPDLLAGEGSSDNKIIFHRAERTEKELMEYSIQLNAVNNPEKSVRAFATVVFGDSFKVTNVAVQERQERASQQMQTDERGFMKCSGEPLPFR